MVSVHNIEIDDEVYNHIKKHAEPFIDTPNTVLRKLLFEKKRKDLSINKVLKEDYKNYNLIRHPSFIPSALSQVLDMIYLVKKYNISRSDATNFIANDRKIYPQTIIDKYCRQLDKKAFQIDTLLESPDLSEFISLLSKYYPIHTDYIYTFLKDKLYLDNSDNGINLNSRKKRNIELENKLKISAARFLSNESGWGEFINKDDSVFYYPKVNKSILCRFSSYDDEHSKWFWGVSEKNWSNWSSNDYLVLIYENEDGKGYFFILISPGDSKNLFLNCSISGDAKKINMRRYTSDGHIHIQEFQDFDLSSSTFPISAK